jgi:hypothetical protein
VSIQPLVDRIGSTELRLLTAKDVRTALAGLSGQLSSRSLPIAHNCLERAIRHAQASDIVGRNLATLVRPPAGRAGRPSKALNVEQAQALVSVIMPAPSPRRQAGFRDHGLALITEDSRQR